MKLIEYNLTFTVKYLFTQIYYLIVDNLNLHRYLFELTHCYTN